MKNIYPIYLDERIARDLCDQHCRAEFDRETRFHPRICRVLYDFTARLLRTGEVELWVTYDYDNGSCMAAGNVLRQTLQPFTEEQIAQIVGGEKFRLAKAAYDERKRKQEERAIRKLMGKMFPTKRRAREIHPLRQS